MVVDKNTEVNYFFVKSGYAGGLTPLLDEDGNTVIVGQDLKGWLYVTYCNL